MIEIVPDYYYEFSCIAGKCKHSCCAGWEVDIDADSLARFQADGVGHIILNDGTPHFELREDLSCSFLNDKGLCDLIIARGEDYLCQICTDHPRYRNFWTGITETGLGLSCEECARIILNRQSPMKLLVENEAGIRLDESELIASLPDDEQYLWHIRAELLESASHIDDAITARLTEYLIFRHIADALYDDRLEKRIAFVQYCVNAVLDAWDASEDQSDEALIEIARSFSAEIEYNETRKNELIEKM